MSSESTAGASWSETAKNIIRGGEIMVRVGSLTAVVYGIYWAFKATFDYLHTPLLSLTQLEQILFAVLSFAGAAITILTHDHFCRLGKFRSAGLISLISAAILLIPSFIAGMIMLLGGLLLYVGAEIFHVAKMIIEPREG
uniref:DUF4064 domain-containing protein n=1 Tax=Thermofilum pendens TaxID=2269 RepID=A0A7C3WL79_THEPE